MSSRCSHPMGHSFVSVSNFLSQLGHFFCAEFAKMIRSQSEQMNTMAKMTIGVIVNPLHGLLERNDHHKC